LLGSELQQRLLGHLLEEERLELVDFGIIAEVLGSLWHFLQHCCHEVSLVDSFKPVVVLLLHAETAEVTLANRFAAGRARSMAGIDSNVVVERL
jgi:predicted secreted protein